MRYCLAMDRASALRDAVDRSRYLRAVGPTTDEFMRWRDATDELLISLLGADHPTRQHFRDAVGPWETLDAEGLQIHGQHGMVPRIERGAELLRGLRGSEAAS